MLPGFYFPVHPEGRLSVKDRILLQTWAVSVPLVSNEQNEHSRPRIVSNEFCAFSKTLWHTIFWQKYMRLFNNHL